MSSPTPNANGTAFARDVLSPLVRGTDLERSEARDALAAILTGQVADVHVASFLTALTSKGETAAEMTGFVDAMIDAANTFRVDPQAIDIVGTGGDQLHTVNISTMASFVVAGCGVKVAKHGNRAASSSVGSADVLEGLGVRLDLSVEAVQRCVEEAGIGFCYAPTFNPALAHLGPIRRALGFRTIFNVLGPLANPALVTRTLVGVAQARLMAPMADVLQARGTVYAILVHAEDGLDELSLGSLSRVIVVEGDDRHEETLDAGAELGLVHDVASLRGGDVTHNVEVVHRFLDGTPGPVFDVVCANAGLALRAAGVASTLREGFELSVDSVRSGRARHALDGLVLVSNA
ncbi:MAG: anthranilate phosphoribosyltransferase [Acidobacteriota bacterium]|nr:anthranilate phosphoribosyltransferase [Acidobacteriota bacterium]MDE3043808.1 anthranilate phosphoribosyltransferase [Acidobacteriota bacterium]MDE3106702.1 anthranilate phosphoribosyltransferase [Acidobacteriota bacterium]MDE3223226.1 anthranilate phosphoribosyltransferase [Acidobacteriota bacterium]